VLAACGSTDSKPIDPELVRQVKPMVLAPGWVTGSSWPTDTVVALNSVALRSTSLVKGNVSVLTAGSGAFLQGNSELFIATNAEVTGNVRADSLDMQVAGHVFGTAAYNQITGSGSIDGARTTPLTTPVPVTVVAAANFSPGSSNTVVSAGSTTSRSAGSHGNWTLNAGTATSFATLRLSSGTYNVNSITVGTYGRLECNGTCEVRVKGRIAVGTGGYVGAFGSSAPNLTSMKLFVEGANGVNVPTGTPAAASFGVRSELKAYTFVPNGTLSMADQVTGVGKFIAKDVEIGAGTELMDGATTQRVLPDRWIVGPSWPNEVITAWSSLDFQSGVNLTGNSVTMYNTSSHMNGAEAAIGTNARINGQVTAERITVASGAQVTLALYNSISNSGTVSAAVTPVAIPLRIRVPVFPIITTSSGSYTVPSQLDYTRAAGRQRDITLNSGVSTNATTLTLTGGVYEMRRLTLGNYAKIICTAACELRVNDRITTGSNSSIGPAPGLDASKVQVFVYRNDSGPTDTPFAVTVGSNNLIDAFIFAPRGNMSFGSGTTLRGRFIGEHVRVGTSAATTRAGTTELAPTIQTQPQSATVTQGQSVTFSVVASGTDVAFQWRRNGVSIAGATSGSYTVASPALADSGASFTVTVSNTVGSVTSSAAILTVNVCDPLTYMPTTVMCGTGVCARTGTLSCVDGSIVDSCVAGSPTGSDNDCDGLDDDCDGSVDEGFVPAATTCGVGACSATGMSSCVAGVLRDSCDDTAPAANDATCDGRDDDCNGQVDEDFVAFATTCGEGVCRRTGMATCSGGSLLDSCNEGSPTGTDNDCDGVDEDCDGEADQDYESEVTSCGTGACASTGATDCVNGVEIDSCRAGNNAPNDLSCNGVDDDCNGQVDDGYVPTATSCGTGACAATGATVCVSGEVESDCTEGTPTSDANCNNVDNDCDGQVDEHYVSVVTSCGSGACASTGATSCVAGSVQNSCTVPTADNDGDGTPNCSDGCPDNAPKTAPGTCGCATPDSDSDSDSSPDCVDACPLDPNDDEDGDGVCGDVDNCPTESNPDQENIDSDEDGDACDSPVAVAASSGGTHTCAILVSGQVGCWGANNAGQLGNGTTSATEVATPVLVTGLTGAVALSMGHEHSCALLGSGEVRCWGANASGQLGHGSTTASSTPVTVSNLGDATQIAAGHDHTCAARADGTAVCWGSNTTRNLGAGTSVTTTCGSPAFSCSTTPVAVTGLTGVVEVGSGHGYSCARSGGTVSCWGSNSDGQVGNSTQALNVNAATPVQVTGVTTATSIGVGGLHACATLMGGAVTCWGSNPNGQLGDGTTTDARTAVLVSGVADATSVESGLLHTCVRRASGSLACWGSNTYGQLGNNGLADAHVPVDVVGISDAQVVSAGDTHSCALRASGELSCWGDASFGQLGGGAVLTVNLPRMVAGVSGVASVVAGDSHTCAAMSDGTVRCWGFANYGQLGDGERLVLNSSPTTVSGLTGVAALTSGLYHTCARLSAGQIQCWGLGTSGQLGNGGTTNQFTPVTVTGLFGVAKLVAGGRSTCAVLSSGVVRCWGAGSVGQLGNGGTSNSSSPVTVTGISTATDVALGSEHACALLADGTVRCWGMGLYGRLGNGSATNQLTPVAVSGLTDAVSIAAGVEHTCAVRATGGVSCWGRGHGGRLGDGIGSDRTTPVAVSGLTNVALVRAGYAHTCARLASSQVRCWGDNIAGQLGDGTYQRSLTPVVAANVFDALDVAAGYEHTCATRADGQLRCWGASDLGQLGNGYPSSSVPLRVLW
jgi:alpha-tubulin suppressor-like RCC1 family protein